MTRLKEQYKQGEITLDQALAEIAKGNRGLRRSKTARYFNKIKKQTKPAKKVKQVDVDVPVEIEKDLKPLTLKQCMKARTEFEPMPGMTPEKQTTLLGHMGQAIERLKGKRKQAN